MVPSADVSKCRLDADIGFDEASHLLQAAAEFALVLRTVGGRIWSAAEGLDHFYCLERLLSRGQELRIRRCRVHALDDAGRLLIADLELFETVYGHCRP